MSRAVVDPSNPNVVIFDKFVVELEGRDPLIFPLNSAEALLSLQKTKFRIKQVCSCAVVVVCVVGVSSWGCIPMHAQIGDLSALFN